MNLVHHWMAEVYAVSSGEEHTKLRRELDDRFIGYLDDSETQVDTVAGIPRPSWFKPGGPTMSEVALIGAAAKGMTK